MIKMNIISNFISEYSLLSVITSLLTGATPFALAWFKVHIKANRQSKDLKEKQETINDLNLDMEKKKYQYEERSKCYYDFLNKFDEFNETHTVSFSNKIVELMCKFMNDENFTEEMYHTELMESLIIVNEYGLRQFVILKNASNALKLHASKEVSNILTELLNVLEKGFKFNQEKVSTGILDMSDEDNTILTELANELNLMRDKLIDEMRKDIKVDV